MAVGKPEGIHFLPQRGGIFEVKRKGVESLSTVAQPYFYRKRAFAKPVRSMFFELCASVICAVQTSISSSTALAVPLPRWGRLIKQLQT